MELSLDDERRSALRQGSGISETGYRIAMNVGPDAGQVVAHLHLHLMGGRRLVSGS